MACACAGDIVEAEVGVDMGLGGSGGADMAGAVGVGGRDDGRGGFCCCCVFTLGPGDQRCALWRAGATCRGGGKEDTGDDRDDAV